MRIHDDNKILKKKKKKKKKKNEIYQNALIFFCIEIYSEKSDTMFTSLWFVYNRLYQSWRFNVSQSQCNLVVMPPY